MIDYSTSNLNVDNLRNDDGSEIFALQNNNIESLYQKAENIRLGIEYKMDAISLRAGYARSSSPIIESEDLLSENYSFGAGIDYGSYYFDFAYVLSQANDTYQMYNSQFVNSTDLAYTNHHAVITLGLRY
jgi:predicted porin